MTATIDASAITVPTREIVIAALEHQRVDVIVSHMPGDGERARKLAAKLRGSNLTNSSWRYYQRSDHTDNLTKVIVMSPLCHDPEPPMDNWNEKKKRFDPPPKPEPVPQTDGLHEWVLHNLTSTGMLHISVVPKQDIQRLKGVPNYETYMTQQVRHAMHRDDVRVMVREPNEGEYNATLIFL